MDDNVLGERLSSKFHIFSRSVASRPNVERIKPFGFYSFSRKKLNTWDCIVFALVRFVIHLNNSGKRIRSLSDGGANFSINQLRN